MLEEEVGCSLEEVFYPVCYICIYSIVSLIRGALQRVTICDNSKQCTPSCTLLLIGVKCTIDIFLVDAWLS